MFNYTLQCFLDVDLQYLKYIWNDSFFYFIYYHPQKSNIMLYIIQQTNLVCFLKQKGHFKII